MNGEWIMVNRKRFCVVCGAEETPTVRLSNGLCQKCSAKGRTEALVYTTPTIRLCKICGSLEARGKWNAPSPRGLENDLSILLKRVLNKSVEVRGEEIISVLVARVPMPLGSGGVLIPISIRTQSSGRQREYTTRESDSKVRLTAVTCPNCTLIRQNYYEATLQIRASSERMTSEEKERLLGQISSWVQQSSRKYNQAFISKYEDKPEGFDLYLGSRRVANSISSKFRAIKGTTIKETFKVGKVDKSTGKRKGKVTILIRLPQQIIYESASRSDEAADYSKN
jgi:nonsense-mediated mRNA decay protein 3